LARVVETEAVLSFSVPGDPDPDPVLFATVSALDPNLDLFTTSGVAGEAFGKLPISSVAGGFGVVGARTPGKPQRVYLELP
jgi:hypothetical protein